MIRTIKTKQFKILAALLALVLMVSCVMLNATKVHAQELSIDNANVQGYSLYGGRGGVITDDNKLVGEENNSATMSVFITGGSQDKYNATNLKWEHDGAGWYSETNVLYEGANSQQKIYACAPYTEDAADAVVTVTAAEQTDWLVATSTSLTSSEVNLTMTHALTKLVIVPTFGSEVTDTSIEKIEIGGMYASGSLEISTNTWSNLSEANATLEMTNNELLVIPMESCTSFEVVVTMESGKVFTTTVNCPVIDDSTGETGLAAGTQYNITLQVGQDKVTIGGINAEAWEQIPVDETLITE